MLEIETLNTINRGTPNNQTYNLSNIDENNVSLFKNNSNNFYDSSQSSLSFVDMLNPLQHIPVVSSVYRHLTNDQIHPVARMAGGAIFGGPIGAIASIIDILVQTHTGADISRHAARVFTDDTPKLRTPVYTEEQSYTFKDSQRPNTEGNYPLYSKTERTMCTDSGLQKPVSIESKNHLDSSTQSHLLQICALKDSETKFLT